METLFQDLRYACRQLGKSRGFTLVALLTVAVGIGSNAAIFSFVDALYLKPLPVSHPKRLVRIYAKGPSGHYGAGFSYPEFLQLRDHNSSFAALSVETQVAQLHLVSAGDSEEARGEFVSANYFSTVGVQPALGRAFLPQEDSVPNRDAVAVISDRLWKARFNQDPAILGREILVNGTSIKVIGVAPPDFFGDFTGRPTELWMPATMVGAIGYGCDDRSYNCSLFDAILARLADGTTPLRAQAEISSSVVWSATDWPDRPSRRQAILTMASGESPDERAVHLGQMQMLMSVTASLLLIACANLAGLLLARGVTRRREIAIRLSIGARRSRVIRQLLTESLLLASLGGAFGLAFALGGKKLLSNFYATDSEGFHHVYDLNFDWRVLVYSVALALITGVLFGLLPALRASRQDLVTELKDGSSASQHTRGFLRHALVVAQLALCMVLVIASGLLIRSASKLQRGTNFDPQRMLVLRLRPELTQYTPAQTESLVRRLDQQLAATPAVESVAFMQGGEGLVWDWQSGRNARVSLSAQAQSQNGQTQTEDQSSILVRKQDIGTNFLHTLRIPLLQGREFQEQDRPGSPLVAIVNQTLAQRLWPNSSAVGETLFVNAQPYRIIGIAADLQPHNVTFAPEPHLYLSYWQSNATKEGDIRFAIRTADDTSFGLPAIRSLVQSVDPNVPIGEDMPLREQLRLEYTPVRLAQNVMSFCGALALCLSIVGLYSVLAFSVRTRIREFGIRMALGAGRKDVLRLVLGQGTRVALIGLAAGAIAALVSSRLLAGLLFGVTATDPSTYLVVMILLAFVALAACYVPARRATRVEPMQALRIE